MQVLFSLSTPALFSVLAGFVGLCAIVAIFVLIVGARAGEVLRTNVPVPTFLGVVAAAWALSLGFAASDLWSLGARADRIELAERSSAIRLLGVSAPNAINAPALRDAVVDYVQLVGDNEWSDHRGQTGDPAVEGALQAIRIAIIETVSAGIPGAIASKIVQDFDELQDARAERLAIGQSLIDESKWALLLSLTFLAMLTIAVQHTDRPIAGYKAIVIFAATVLLSLWSLVLHWDPYASVRFDPFATIPFSVEEAAEPLEAPSEDPPTLL